MGPVVGRYDRIDVSKDGFGPVLDVMNRMRGHEDYTRRFGGLGPPGGRDLRRPADYRNQLFAFLGSMLPDLLSGPQNDKSRSNLMALGAGNERARPFQRLDYQCHISERGFMV